MSNWAIDWKNCRARERGGAIEVVVDLVPEPTHAWETEFVRVLDRWEREARSEDWTDITNTGGTITVRGVAADKGAALHDYLNGIVAEANSAFAKVRAEREQAESDRAEVARGADALQGQLRSLG